MSAAILPRGLAGPLAAATLAVGMTLGAGAAAASPTESLRPEPRRANAATPAPEATARDPGTGRAAAALPPIPSPDPSPASGSSGVEVDPAGHAAVSGADADGRTLPIAPARAVSAAALPPGGDADAQGAGRAATPPPARPAAATGADADTAPGAPLPSPAVRPKARPAGMPVGRIGAEAAVQTVAVQLPGLRAVPRPPERPAGLVRAARLEEAGRAATASAPVSAAPAAARVATAAAAATPRPPERPGLFGGLFRRSAQPAPPAQGSVCGNRAIRGQAIPPVPGERAGCGIPEPVRITEVAGIRLSTSATVDCVTAQALHDWVVRGAKPAVGRTGGGLVALQVAAHYACRTRNNRPGARISEHGRGRAIDISALVLASGERITVLHGWRSRQAGPILRRMHAAACGPFGTVLGPDADRFHQDHFHFDTARYRSGPYCR